MGKGFLVVIYLLMGNLFSTAQQQDLIYVYNAGEDSLHFPELGTLGLFRVHSCTLVDSMDVNGDGHPEMVFHRYFSGNEEAHGGTFDISTKQEISVFEIWDLQAKACLFSGMMSMFLSDNRFDIHSTHNGHFGKCHYSNKISLFENGSILVEALEQRAHFTQRNSGTPFTPEACTCSTSAGVYVFKDDAFVLDQP